MLYEVENLTKTYSGRTVLNVADLALESGKVYGLLGPNGAGKTTLLEILGFLRTPTTGEIRFRGERVQFVEPVLRRLRRRVVVVEQHPILFTTSVYKNVEFGPKMRKVPRAERDKVVWESLERVGMQDFAHARANRLSGGETQRVAIARALACSPQVLFLDEPTSNVDVQNQIAIESIIREINRDRSITVMMTSHNLLQARKLTDDFIYLFQGRPASSIYENLYPADVVEAGDNGRKECVLRDQLRIPLETERTGAVQLAIDPRMIRIERSGGGSASAASDSGTSARKKGSFSGRVLQVTEEAGGVRILVDVGVPLGVYLTYEEYRGEPVLVGEQVKLSWPEGAVTVL
jgi:tungstate transport system ATP-binding protein